MNRQPYCTPPRSWTATLTPWWVKISRGYRRRQLRQGQRLVDIETQNIEAHGMTVDQAVMQMDLIHDDLLVFTNVETGQVNILRRLPDGNFGLIEATNANDR